MHDRVVSQNTLSSHGQLTPGAAPCAQPGAGIAYTGDVAHAIDWPVDIDSPTGTADTPPVKLVPDDAPAPRVPEERRGSVRDRRRSVRAYRSLDLAAAMFTLAAVFVTVNAASAPAGLQEFLSMRVTVKNVVLLVACSIGWVASFGAMGLYSHNVRYSRREEVIRTLIACALGTGGVLLFPLASNNAGALSYDAVAAYSVAVTVVVVTLRLGTTAVRRAARRRSDRRVLIVGSGPRAMELSRQLAADSQVNYRVLGFVDSPRALARYGCADRGISTLDDLEQTLMHTVVDEVLIALPIKSHYAEIETTIGACERAGVYSKYLADVFKPSLARQRFESTGDMSLMSLAVVQDDYRLMVKRALDLVSVVVTLPVTVTVAAMIAVAVKVTSKGPVFFKQERFGRAKRRFTMYKFRTMVADAETHQLELEDRNEAVGPVFKIRDDPRITSLGRLLRSHPWTSSLSCGMSCVARCRSWGRPLTPRMSGDFRSHG